MAIDNYVVNYKKSFRQVSEIDMEYEIDKVANMLALEKEKIIKNTLMAFTGEQVVKNIYKECRIEMKADSSQMVYYDRIPLVEFLPLQVSLETVSNSEICFIVRQNFMICINK